MNRRTSGMQFMNIVWTQQASIIRSSRVAIVHGMLDTWARCRQRGNSPEEPDFVAGLVLESTPLIYDSLKAILAPHRIAVSVASVFCHQTPKVTHPLARKSCELGDLLFVHTHTQSRGRIRRNALLYQAKKSSRQPYRLPKSEEHQLALYTDWPQFTYTSPGHLAGMKRDVSPKAPHTGAQYMLIDDRPPSDPQSGLLCLPGTYPIGSCMADKHLHDHNSLAHELFDLFRLRSGKAFEDRATAAATEGWSRTIWDLVDVGLKKAFNRKNSGRRDAPRVGGTPMYLADGTCFAAATGPAAMTTVAGVLGSDGAASFFQPSADAPPPDDRVMDECGDPDSGVSVILIETSEATREE